MELKSLCDGKISTVTGGNRIRPCDACGVRRARWFCAADDAYLCHLCDTSVHSANSVACKHERVKIATGTANLLDSQSSWSRKRSRSDRKSSKYHASPLLYPFDTPNSKNLKCPKKFQLMLSSQEYMESDVNLRGMEVEELDLELGSLVGVGSHDEQEDQLLGLGLGLGLCEEAEIENMNTPSLEWLFDKVKVEVEDGNLKIEGPDIEPFDLNANFSDFTEEEVKINLDVDDVYSSNTEEKKICLKLNYEDVLSAWCGRGSPWADQNSFHTFLDDSGSEATGVLEYGVVPDLNAGNGGCEESIENVPVTQYKSSGGFREARVMRYREKRRNRLFSKRIRYQVRKLNAEQRPRMKGRFVKKEPELFSVHKHER